MASSQSPSPKPDRYEKLYNTLVDAEREIWNRRAGIRADNYRLVRRNGFARWLQRLGLVADDLVDLEIDASLRCKARVGSYADIEDPYPDDERKIARRERFRIIGKPVEVRDGVLECRAQRIEAPDYAATQSLRLVRFLILLAAIQIIVVAYMRVWEQQPHVVSLGAQKNFASFAQDIAKAWKSSDTRFGEAYFREAVAKAIVFKRTERIVSAQTWYEGGYRANIVAYAIAKVAHDVSEKERAVNFEQIWRAQAVSRAMETALTRAAKAAYEVLTAPPEGMRNVTEWAKKQACWDRIRSSSVSLPSTFLEELLSLEEEKDRRRSARRDQRQLSGIEAQMAVVNAGGQFWRDVAAWGRERQLLGAKDLGVLARAGQIPTTLPTERQVRVLVDLVARLGEQHDCPYELQ